METRRWRLSFEWTVLTSLLTVGVVSGIASVRDAVIDEMGDVAQAMVALDQSYYIQPPLAAQVHTVGWGMNGWGFSGGWGGFGGAGFGGMSGLRLDVCRCDGLPGLLPRASHEGARVPPRSTRRRARRRLRLPPLSPRPRCNRRAAQAGDLLPTI